MKTAVMKLLSRLGLMHADRTLTDADRRKIITLLEAGMTPESIAHGFGYGPADVENAIASDLLTGRLPL